MEPMAIIDQLNSTQWMYYSFSTKPLKKTHQLINKIIFHDSYMGIEMHGGITKQKIYQLLAFTMHHLQQLSLSHSLLIG